MQTGNTASFLSRLRNKKEHFPFSGLLELTYGCGLNCVHCYCKGSENKKKELTSKEWQNILIQLHKQGCLWITFSGGDPLFRKDFLEIYDFAIQQGFIITIFTSGMYLSDRVLGQFQKSPPFSIEITLNGISESVYESITQVKGSFNVVMRNIKRLHENGLQIILKSNCLKQNKSELGKIKEFAETLLKPKANRHRFKYDPMIYPRLNGSLEPACCRLSAKELLQTRKTDAAIWKEYEKGLCAGAPNLGRNKQFLYRCNAWMNQFFIDPTGRLKFCQFSEKFSTDLKTGLFKNGFYNVFPKLLNKTFKTDSKCADCSLRPICYHCPARAYLETGNEEAPVPYYCELAQETALQMKNIK
jgi:radical SAM protein with 4Fe4S-binding SPASM domain